MIPLVIAYPEINPVALQLGPLPIRWYALAYIAGLVIGWWLARRIVAQAPLARYRPEEFRPGPRVQSDEELLRAAGELGTTIFHPVGTAAMGPASDPQAVLDERLRVRGLERLRVIDASAMPRITSGNTNSPTLMIAEKGAAMVLEDARCRSA